MTSAYLKIELKVKFRAFGVTFGNINENRTVILPPEAQLIESLVGPTQFFTYNDHGVYLALTLTDKPA